MATRREQIASVYALCRECAAGVWSERCAGPPSAEYQRRVANQLWLTALAESGDLEWDRQIAFGEATERGGWSWWQLQDDSVTESLRRLDQRCELERRCAAWLFGRGGEIDLGPIRAIRRLDRMRLVRRWPRLAVLLARLHYLWDAELVSGDVEMQAAYWVRVYNRGGKADPERYLACWARWETVAIEAQSDNGGM